MLEVGAVVVTSIERRIILCQEEEYLYGAIRVSVLRCDA